MGAPESYTIEELAAEVGMTPRNVRAYRTKGLLPPPVRDGRASSYRIVHLRRLRHVRALRDAGLPLKMIISAAGRGEDLGPAGALWQAADRLRVGAKPRPDPDSTALDAYIGDPRAYALMQALTGWGLPPTTVMLLALRSAQASRALALDLITLLDQELDQAAEPEPPITEVVDLATVITREMLGNALATAGAVRA